MAAKLAFANRRFSREQLLAFGGQLLLAAGLRPADAELMIDSLVEANLRGVDSHGIARLPHYLRRLELGSIKAQPQIRVEQLGRSAARVHGDQGLGQLVTQRATTEAIAMARESGAGWVSVCNSSHCGALAYFGQQLAAAGMVGLVFTHVGSLVLPYGSREPFCGTNPICITAPRSAGPVDELATGAVCLDMSTSVIPWNIVMNARQEEVPLEPGWAVDAEGEPTTDPEAVASLHAVGGPKGSGLGLMIDIMCSLLSGAPYGPDIPKMYGDLTKPRTLGGLVGAINIGHFLSVEQFQQRLTALTARWNALPPAAGFDRVEFPGEPELRERQVRLREGIPLGMHLIEEFEGLAEKYGVGRLDV